MSSSSRVWPLERSYRRLLRVLPREHRERWEDDMVAVLLDAEQEAAARAVAAEGAERQDEERELVLLQRPPLREVLGVLGLALRLHLAAPSTPGASARSRAVGDAVRLTALLGLLLPAAHGVVQLAAAPWLWQRSDRGPVPPLDSFAWTVATLSVVLTWTLLVAGHRRTAVGAAVAGVAVPAVLELDVVPDVATAGEAVTRLVLLVPLLALAAWHRDAPRPSPRWWWTLPAAVVGVLGLWGLEVAGATGASFAAEPLVAAAALVVGLRRADRGWLGAAVVLGVVALVRGAVSLGQLVSLPGAYAVVVGALTAASALVVGVALVRSRVLARAARPAAQAPLDAP